MMVVSWCVCVCVCVCVAKVCGKVVCVWHGGGDMCGCHGSGVMVVVAWWWCHGGGVMVVVVS
jgi:hypothetical protein